VDHALFCVFSLERNLWRAIRLLPFLFVLPASPQRNSAAFGLCTETGLDGFPSGLAVRPALRRIPAEIALVSSRDTGLRLYVIDAGGTWSFSRAMEFASPRRSIRAADVDRDGDPEYVTLSNSGREISILKRHRRSFQETAVPLLDEARTVLTADLNSDGRIDLLGYGRSMAGIAWARRNRAGSFEPPKTLFADLSASACAVTDLNGDGISDIFVLDWLADRMVLFFGISDTVFSEQVSISLPGEPRDITLADVRPGRSLRAAITLPEREAVFVYTVNAAGEFFLDGTISCPAPPGDIQFTDITGDGLPDVITATDSGFVVAPARTRSRFSNPLVYGALSRAGLWQTADMDGDGRRDLVLADSRNRRILVAANAGVSSNLSWSPSYLAGVEPAGIAVADLDFDGRDDLVVANSGSASLSAFRGRGDGTFRPGVFIPVPERPRWINVLAAPPETRPSFLVEHPQANLVVLVEPADDLTRSLTSTVPTGPSPVVLAADRGRGGAGIRFFVRTTGGRQGSLMASLFERIAPQRFLERGIHTQTPIRIAALAAGDFAGSGRYDLLYAAEERGVAGLTLSRASAPEEYEFTSVTPLLHFADSLSGINDLAAQDVDGDGNLDVLLFPSGAGREGIGILYGLPLGALRDTVAWIPGIRPPSRRLVIVRDVNGDAKVDIIAFDQTVSAVVGCFGFGALSFGEPVRLVEGKGITGMAIGSFRTQDRLDLVIANGRRGSITFVPDPFTKGAR
jgi:hypothetical protein